MISLFLSLRAASAWQSTVNKNRLPRYARNAGNCRTACKDEKMKISENHFNQCNQRFRQIRKMKNIFKLLQSISLLFILLNFTSCLIVKEADEIIRKEKESTTAKYEIVPRATVKMSDKIVRSMRGDMIASLPEGWFFIEPSGGVSSEIFAIATNPDYTVSAVFSHLRKTNEMSETVKKEGLIGLARIVFNKRNAKSSSGINLVDNYQILNFTRQQFGFFTFTNPQNNTFGSSTVFVSGINEFYEFSLVTMNFTNNEQPTRIEFDKIFNSILATLKY